MEERFAMLSTCELLTTRNISANLPDAHIHNACFTRHYVCLAVYFMAQANVLSGLVCCFLHLKGYVGVSKGGREGPMRLMLTLSSVHFIVYADPTGGL